MVALRQCRDNAGSRLLAANSRRLAVWLRQRSPVWWAWLGSILLHAGFAVASIWLVALDPARTEPVLTLGRGEVIVALRFIGPGEASHPDSVRTTSAPRVEPLAAALLPDLTGELPESEPLPVEDQSTAERSTDPPTEPRPIPPPVPVVAEEIPEPPPPPAAPTVPAPPAPDLSAFPDDANIAATVAEPAQREETPPAEPAATPSPVTPSPANQDAGPSAAATASDAAGARLVSASTVKADHPAPESAAPAVGGDEEQSAPPAMVGAVTGVRVAQPPSVDYPDDSRKRGEEGVVVLEVEVNASGQVGQVRVVSDPGFPSLVAAARRAVMRCQFLPATLAGQPVAATIRIPFRFVLRS